jgi:hypothetical protein
MRKILLILFAIILKFGAVAQIPNFGTTVGDQKLYGYSSLKYRVNSDTWETYSTIQYGFSNYFQTGADLYTIGGKSYIGYVVRGGYKVCNNFKIGAQLTPSFDLGNNHKFSYLTSALYINGNISQDGKLFYVTDTWFENDKSTLTSAKQWSYLGYTIPLRGNSNSITPMAGIIHSWKFDKDVDLSFGCYYSHKNVNLYAWTNDILTKHPRFILAIEFAFSNK